MSIIQDNYLYFGMDTLLSKGCDKENDDLILYWLKVCCWFCDKFEEGCYVSYDVYYLLEDMFTMFNDYLDNIRSNGEGGNSELEYDLHNVKHYIIHCIRNYHDPFPFKRRQYEQVYYIIDTHKNEFENFDSMIKNKYKQMFSCDTYEINISELFL